MTATMTTTREASPAPGICPGCGWAVRSEPGQGFACARCAYLASKPQRIGTTAEPVPPLSKRERMFLAALLLYDEVPGGDHLDAQLMGVAARMLTRRLAPPTPFSGGGPSHRVEAPPRTADELPALTTDPMAFHRLPLGTAPAVLRAYLARLAAHWKAHDCPLR